MSLLHSPLLLVFLLSIVIGFLMVLVFRYTSDQKAIRVAKKVKSGMVWVNTFGKLFAAGEMGGFKQSGIGRQYGLEGLWEFTEMKHINIQL